MSPMHSIKVADHDDGRLAHFDAPPGFSASNLEQLSRQQNQTR